MKKRGAEEGSGAKRRWQREERVGASWEEIIFAKHELSARCYTILPHIY